MRHPSQQQQNTADQQRERKKHRSVQVQIKPVRRKKGQGLWNHQYQKEGQRHLEPAPGNGPLALRRKKPLPANSKSYPESQSGYAETTRHNEPGAAFGEQCFK
jgi:hypothetical protein